MTLANLKIQYARLKWLASGEFTERDFDYKIEANANPNGIEKGEGGWSTMGEFINKAGAKRKELIIFKAKKTLEDFESKYPEFKEAEKVAEKVVDNTIKKSKEKK